MLTPSIAYDEVTLKARETLFNSASYLSQRELVQLEEACAFAFQAHAGQTRKSGEPYITHPIAVATEVAIWGEDITTLISALLHDVLEDTGTEKNKLAELFGDQVAKVVDGLSKLEKLEGKGFLELQAESFRKMLLAMVHDLRVLVIKLADRLHNMRTLDVMRPDKQKRVAKETLEVYSELANRIGMNPVYRELQDLSFKYLYPYRFDVMRRALEGWRQERTGLVGSVLVDFCTQLTSSNIEATVKGNEKHLYAIFKKMQAQNLHFSKVMDMYGFVVLVNSVSDCYRALGSLHTLYKPKPGSFKDFIAIPKKNGYQSLHTTLVNSNGLPIEVQIRTYEMDGLSEAGSTNVHLFKLRKTASNNSVGTSTKKWFDNIKQIQQESDNAVDFYEDVKKDLFPDDLYLFTPQGKIITLPKKSTPVDFAYSIHTDIGRHCVGAKVNGVLVPLRHQLKSGDIVEIETNSSGTPNPSWLSFVVSARARSAIRSQLKNMSREDAINLGEKLLQKVLVNLLPSEIIFSEDLKDQFIDELSNKNLTFEDLLYDVGMSKILPIKVAIDIAELAGKFSGEEVKLSPIAICGDQTRKIHLSACCNPIPGDMIKVVLVKEQGLLVHRENCSNLLKFSAENQLDARWDDVSANKKFKVRLSIEARDAQGLLAQIASSITANQANIEYVETPSVNQTSFDGFIEFIFGLEIQHGLTVLNNIIKTLTKIPQVKKVTRK